MISLKYMAVGQSERECVCVCVLCSIERESLCSSTVYET